MRPGPELGPLLALITNPRTSTPDTLQMGRDALVYPNIPSPPNSLSVNQAADSRDTKNFPHAPLEAPWSRGCQVQKLQSWVPGVTPLCLLQALHFGVPGLV